MSGESEDENELVSNEIGQSTTTAADAAAAAEEKEMDDKGDDDDPFKRVKQVWSPKGYVGADGGAQVQHDRDDEEDSHDHELKKKLFG